MSSERPKKRASSPQVTDDSDHEGNGSASHTNGGPNRKRKKRATFSCGECKRRKIKCDRQMPCDQCTTRGEIELCEFEVVPSITRRAPPPRETSAYPPPYTMQALASRLSHLEQMFTTAFPHLHTPPRGVASPSLSAPRSGLDSDTEDAVLALEDLARGQGVASSYGTLGVTALKEGPEAPLQTTPDSRTLSYSGGNRATSSILRLEASEKPDDEASASLDYALASLSGTDEQVLQRIYNVLPPVPVARYLISVHFDHVDWMWHVHHRPSFMSECVQFWRLGAEECMRIDPAWLAMYAQTLALGANASSGRVGPQCATYPLVASGQAPIIWFEASKMALGLANWAVKPQFRVIQTLILYGALIRHVGSPFIASKRFSVGMNSHFSVWLAAAIRLAHMMGLHKLGNDITVMPPDDAAFPLGPSGLRREMGVRVWNFLVILDWKTSVKSGDYLITPSSFTTVLPINCDDEDLTLDIVVHPKPAHRLTDVMHLIYARALVDHCLRVAELLRFPEGISYDSILAFDAQFRAKVSPLLGEGLMLPENRDKQRWIERRAALRAALHNRLLRLHRPFMVRGFRNPVYQRSHAACLESAEIILDSQQFLHGSTIERSWYSTAHALGGIIVMFLDTFNRIDTGQPDAEGRAAQIQSARFLFERLCQDGNAAIAEIAHRGRQIVDSLQKEAALRRSAHACRPKGGPRSPGQLEADAESLRAVFKRVATAVSDVRVPPPPVASWDAQAPVAEEVQVQAWDDFLLSLGVSSETPTTTSSSVEPPGELLQQTDWEMFSKEALGDPSFGDFGSLL